ncbi:hypothetical protein D7319_28275 [Streptomyces radicis]|uniref:Uncharacterized protein n=1 Tax=Streptomyces radicis TaxID=1750517 RepID=A0A3A9VVH2_9ACTN|nr:hypothetical protein D7319_28275 [Streptomyces radicis]RKN15510.1 hypothetical protein D7318_27680 [Streptomyces radicis]
MSWPPARTRAPTPAPTPARTRAPTPEPTPTPSRGGRDRHGWPHRVPRGQRALPREVANSGMPRAVSQP